MFDFAVPPKVWLRTAALLLALAVAAGAFGAHALKDKLDAYSLGVYEKAVFYHFLHAFGILVLAAAGLAKVLPDAQSGLVCLLLFLGVVFFSGSLYALAFSGIKAFGAITPIGGTLFIAGWLLLAYYAAR